MEVDIVSPTKCFVSSSDPNEMLRLKKELTYTNKNAAFNLKKLNENRWLRDNRPYTYKKRLTEIKSQMKGCLLKFDPDTQSLWTYPGILDYLDKFDINITRDNRKYPSPKKMVWQNQFPFSLYDYQSQTVDGLLNQKHGCVEICTGGGKTACIVHIVRELGLDAAVVTPSKSIFGEVLKQMQFYLGKNMVGGFGGGKKDISKKVTVCVAKSLSMLKEGTKEFDFFKDKQLLIIDESHTVPADTLEVFVHGVFSEVPYRFFFSGTQVRGDGKEKLLKSIIGKKVHSLTSQKAIEDGYICPLEFEIRNVTTSDRYVKDPLKAKRFHFLYNPLIANDVAKLANKNWEESQQSTLILVEELEQISILLDKINAPLGYAHSASKKEAQISGLEAVNVDQSVEDFNSGKIRVLIGTSCISVGTNIYPCHNTINWVGGSSEVKTKQGAIGRSVRWLHNTKYANFHIPKEKCKIIDYNVQGKAAKLMEKHLEMRLDMYKETGCEIVFNGT